MDALAARLTEGKARFDDGGALRYGSCIIQASSPAFTVPCAASRRTAGLDDAGPIPCLLYTSFTDPVDPAFHHAPVPPSFLLFARQPRNYFSFLKYFFAIHAFYALFRKFFYGFC